MERSSFFNAVLDQQGNPDRSYLAEDFARYFSTFIGNGVFPNPARQLQVVAVDNNMQIRIKAGFAWINGYMYENTDDYIFKLYPADGVLNRIDRVVLRLDFLERKIKAVVKKGEYGSTPKTPNLQRDSDAYEIAIADVLVRNGLITVTQANVTDLRLNKELCGIVHGVVDQVDPTAIFNQFQTWYSETKEAYNKDISKWTKDKKEAFDKWYSENTKTFLDKFNKWYEDNTKQWENEFSSWFKNTEVWTSEFNNWFNNIKTVLDGDIAAKLTSKVAELEKGKIDKSEFNSFKADITKEIGNINDNALPTELKGKSLTEQTKQLFQYASDGKQKIATAVTGKGVSASGSDSFSTLASKISLIETGAKYLDIVNDTDIVNIVVKGDYLYVLKYLYDHAVLYKYSKEGHLIEDYKISISSGQSVCINKDYILHVYYTYYTQKTTIYIYNIETKQIILKKDLREPDSYPKIIMTNSYIYILQTTGTYRILIYNYDLSFVKEITDNNYISYFQYSATTLIKDNILYISYVPGSSSATPQILQLKEKYSGDFTIDTFYNSNILFTFVNTLLGGI
ncbi:hypothetical protein [Clostridium sporogenes]|uniref:hypothetical protein n=1 Tax=Clostridium sporogenes TaxID=1509 RepID=UPI002238EE0A|nr:hypothetical protein [Clostridium sporogenes]MCW6105664.1 hypothetical protein [Clostridium sporogenes]